MIELSSTDLNFSSQFLGLQNYQDVLQKQSQMAGVIRDTKQIQILGMEFRSVITLGIRGNRRNDIVSDFDQIPIVQTDRGGQATLHTPGQLVIYPMMDIDAHKIGVRDLVCLMTKTTIGLLKKYGIESFQGEAPGVYTGRGKLAFLGIRVEKGVVKHGLSLNVLNDISLFDIIKSCGVFSAKIDKMQNYEAMGSKTIAELFDEWIEIFKNELEILQRANEPICGLQIEKDALTIEVNHSRADMA